MSEIILYKDKKECCGCGACMNICPKSAIKMQADEYGFIYPVIQHDLCVQCGACMTVCGYQNKLKTEEPKKVYAAASKNSVLLRKSASGGAFAVIAEAVLKNEGIVYGAALPMENGILEPKHIRVDSLDKLILLQGSKYVQSELGDCFKSIKFLPFLLRILYPTNALHVNKTQNNPKETQYKKELCALKFAQKQLTFS